MDIDMAEMEPLLGKMVTDLGPMMGGALVLIGDNLQHREPMP